MLDMFAAENKKTQAALKMMADENTKRHRIICQKIEELKSSMRHLGTGYGEENGCGQSEPDSDQNGFTDTTLVCCSQCFF